MHRQRVIAIYVCVCACLSVCCQLISEITLFHMKLTAAIEMCDVLEKIVQVSRKPFGSQETAV